MQHDQRPDLYAEECEAREELEHALSALPERLRGPFCLRCLGLFSYDEIASMLDISLGDVKTRIHRARKFLQERYELT